MRSTKTISWIRFLLLIVVMISGLASILATNGSDCVALHEACDENSDCCSHHCEGGSCCRGVPAALKSDDPASDCCSGQIRSGDFGPYCCGTEGMMVDDAEDCCEGLVRVFATGRCEVPCPPGCSRGTSSTRVVGEAVDCVCDDDDDPDTPTTIETPPCRPCSDLSDDNCYYYRVFHDGFWDDEFDIVTGCRAYGPFTAPDDATAEWCARNFALDEGFSGVRPWVVEDITEAASKRCEVE